MQSETTEEQFRTRSASLARSALVFVALIGIVSLLSDMTYEAARGINGAFLAVLGASAVVVGVRSGLAELLGYIVRLASGYVAGRTGRYWVGAILFFRSGGFRLVYAWLIAPAALISRTREHGKVQYSPGWASRR